MNTDFVMSNFEAIVESLWLGRNVNPGTNGVAFPQSLSSDDVLTLKTGLNRVRQNEIAFERLMNMYFRHPDPNFDETEESELPASFDEVRRNGFATLSPGELTQWALHPLWITELIDALADAKSEPPSITIGQSRKWQRYATGIKIAACIACAVWFGSLFNRSTNDVIITPQHAGPHAGPKIDTPNVEFFASVKSPVPGRALLIHGIGDQPPVASATDDVGPCPLKRVFPNHPQKLDTVLVSGPEREVRGAVIILNDDVVADASKYARVLDALNDAIVRGEIPPVNLEHKAEFLKAVDAVLAKHSLQRVSQGFFEK